MDEEMYSHNRGVICVPKGKWVGAPTQMSPVPRTVPGIQQVLSKWCQIMRSMIASL